MFTGLVEETGRIRTVRPRGDGATLVIEADRVLEDASVGDSISISGVCQTIIHGGNDFFMVEAVRETMQRTKFGSWGRGDMVNLERAVRPTDRLGGHIVQGHVDGLVEVVRITPLEGSWRLTISLPEDSQKYVVEKGSIALDGISLTVASVEPDSFEVEVIPHTWQNTTLKVLRPGDRVHVEWDIFAKYVENSLKGYLKSSTGKTGNGGLTPERLAELGF